MNAFLRVVGWPWRKTRQLFDYVTMPDVPDFDKLAQFGTDYEAALAWIREERAKLWLVRIQNMRAWERQTKSFCWAALVMIALQLAIVILLDPVGGGVFQWIVVAFWTVTQTGSVERFAASRDDLLKDLEDDPDAEPFWYYAYTKKWTHDD